MYQFQKIIYTILLLLIIACSCKKETGRRSVDITALNIINAIPGSSGLIANFNSQLPRYLGQLSVDYGTGRIYSFQSGATGLTLRQAADTTHDLCSLPSLELDVNAMYSLFIGGTITSPDTLLVKDQLPAHTTPHGAADSIASIRFVHFSKGNDPVSINIQGQPNGSEANNLAYKGVTSFKSYSATSDIASYTFEFRDAANGNLLTTYVLNGVNSGPGIDWATNTVRFKNLTIVLCGEPGNQSAFMISNN